MLVFREIPHRPMAAWVEDRIEICLRHSIQPFCGCELVFGCSISLEAKRGYGLSCKSIALRVNRRLAAFW